MTANEPNNLSPRIERLRDYYVQRIDQPRGNESISFTTGTPWDMGYQGNCHISQETRRPFADALQQVLQKVELPGGFWEWSLPERQSWFVKEVMVYYLPHRVLSGDLIAGDHFNIRISKCFTEKQAKAYSRKACGDKGIHAAETCFQDHGYGNFGASGGHFVPDYPRVLKEGWKSIHEELNRKLSSLSKREYNGNKGEQIRAMLVAATMARDVAFEYSKECAALADQENDRARKEELTRMAAILRRVPWEPALDFWEAAQSLWITHMLLMGEESCPRPGVRFDCADQYLNPFREKSLNEGMDPEFGREILRCFQLRCDYACDAAVVRGAADINLNLLKAVEHAVTGGYDLIPRMDPMTGKQELPQRWGLSTGDATKFKNWEEFWNAYVKQTKAMIRRASDLYNRADGIRAEYVHNPYLSCLVHGCIDNARDINQGGAAINIATVKAVNFTSTVDLLLAIKILVFDKNQYTMQELIRALRDNCKGHDVLQEEALNNIPGYSRDDGMADEMGCRVMDAWTEEARNYRSPETGKQYRPVLMTGTDA